MTKKVYVVSDGWYSEYQIKGIFSTRQKAEELQKHFSCPNDIEELELDPEVPYPKDVLAFRIEFDTDGNIVFTRRLDSEDFKERTGNRFQQDGVLCNVWARDEEHAVKIATDRRRVYLVEHPPKLNVDQIWEHNSKRERDGQ